MKDINKLMHCFSKFLCSSWGLVEMYIKTDTTGSFKDDWIQANWELLVEGQIKSIDPIKLEVYGDGADANDSSSRILYPEWIPSHQIIVSPKETDIKDVLTNKKINSHAPMSFDKFVTLKNGWYVEEAPFDMILSEIDSTEIVLKIDEINFEVKSFEDDSHA